MMSRIASFPNREGLVLSLNEATSGEIVTNDMISVINALLVTKDFGAISENSRFGARNVENVRGAAGISAGGPV